MPKESGPNLAPSSPIRQKTSITYGCIILTDSRQYLFAITGYITIRRHDRVLIDLPPIVLLYACYLGW